MNVVRYRIFAWLGQTETDRLEAEDVAAYLGLQPERAAGAFPVESERPGGEPRTQGGSPRPLRLDAIGRIGR